MSYFVTSAPTATASVVNNPTYTLAFPPLQAFSSSWTFTSNNKPHDIISTPASTASTSNGSSGSSSVSSVLSPANISFFTPLTPPKYPMYLKYTAYADIVLQQYNDRKAKTLASDDSNSDYRLPQFWNKVTKSRHINNSIQIGINGYDLTYNTVGQQQQNSNKESVMEPITLQTNVPIKPQCGIYYFEIRVIQKGQDGNFAIGFSRKNHKINKLPGCDQYSYGYHGYDGQIYHHDTKGTNYGPTFISGDIIGCCINFATHSAFFTKNGVSLDIAFDSVNTTELLYPCIGLSTNGEKITTNFGQEPFAYDIVQYVKSQQISCINSTCQTEKVVTGSKDKYKVDIKSDMDQLVISYLLQQGYTETANALLKNLEHVKQQNHSKKVTIGQEQHDRNTVRKSVMAGSIDTAIEQTNSLYPGLLQNNPDLTFELKTRKFLDILIDSNNSNASSLYVSDHNSSSDTDDDTVSTYSGRSRTQSFSGHDLHNQVLYEEENENEEKQHTIIKPCSFGHFNTAPLPAAASGRRLSWAAIAAPSSFDTTVVEEMFTPRRKSISTAPRTRRDSNCSSIFEFEQHDDEKMSSIRKAMNYGHQLQEEYQHNSKYLNKLLELFTLLAYSDPKSSPMSHLLDLSHRDTIASELNNAILEYKNHAQDSSLELIYKQSIAINRELICSGHGKASLMNINNYFK